MLHVQWYTIEYVLSTYMQQNISSYNQKVIPRCINSILWYEQIK